MPYPDNFSARRYDEAQGRDDTPEPREPPPATPANMTAWWDRMMAGIKKKESRT